MSQNKQHFLSNSPVPMLLSSATGTRLRRGQVPQQPVSHCSATIPSRPDKSNWKDSPLICEKGLGHKSQENTNKCCRVEEIQLQCHGLPGGHAGTRGKGKISKTALCCKFRCFAHGFSRISHLNTAVIVAYLDDGIFRYPFILSPATTGQSHPALLPSLLMRPAHPL